MKQDGGTVCGKYHQAKSGGVGDQRVARRIIVVIESHAIVGSHSANRVGMDLVGQHHFPGIKAHSIAQAVNILHHIFIIIAPVKADIQAGKGTGADTAYTGGKGMGHENILCS
jgi:hypothetical protein